MTRFPLPFVFPFALLLAACADTEEPVRFITATPDETARITIPMQSVALREVSLPAYATEEGIAIADASGALTSAPDRIWADDPTRAVTLRLTNALADLTGRVVASDPWPFRENPEATVEVRIEEFVAESAGRFVARGRIYVAQEVEGRNDRAFSFTLAEPFAPEAGFPAIAAARSAVVSSLAREIAERGLR
ncbi:MAG: ABC-type transport auxiliary lipoprotein family protein [Pseudomonadota bacterium]